MVSIRTERKISGDMLETILSREHKLVMRGAQTYYGVKYFFFNSEHDYMANIYTKNMKYMFVKCKSDIDGGQYVLIESIKK